MKQKLPNHNSGNVACKEINSARCNHLATSALRQSIFKISLMMLFVLGAIIDANATAYFSRATGNWNSNTTWSLTSGGAAVGAGVFPGSGDAVTIERGFTVTVNVNSAACLSVVINSTGNNTSSKLSFINTGVGVLTVGGTVTLGGTNSGNGNTMNTLDMTNAGTLICNGFALGPVAGANIFTPGAGIVQLAATNTLPSTVFTTFNDLTINGGTTTLGAATTVSGLLTMTSGTLNMADLALSAGSLTGSATITNTTGGTTARTITIGSDGTSPAAYSGIISNGTNSGGVSLTKTGAGTLTLTGVNTYTGTTTITGGEIRYNPSGNVSLSGAASFNGGTLGTSGITATRTLTFASIALPVSSKIDLSTANSHTITFTAAGSFTAATTLTIYGWQGTFGATGSVGQVFVGSTGSSLTGTQLGQIKFNGGTIASPGTTYTAAQLSNGEVVPAATSIASSGTLAAVSSTYGTASGTTSFSLSGTNITASTGITVTAPAGFEVSTSGTFASNSGTSINVGAAGTIASTTVFVRLAATTNAGTYSGNVVLSSAGATDVNVATVTSTVAKKALSITAPSIASRAYDATTTAGAVTTGTLSGFVGTQTVTATGAAAAYSSANVGSYTGTVITYTLADGTNGGLAANYSLANGTATGTITAKALSITAPTIASKVYDATTTAGAVTVGTLSGFIGTETVTTTATAAAYSSANVGSYSGVVVTYTLANGTNGGLAANYSLATGTATGVVTAKALSITAPTIASKVYNATATAGAVTVGTLSGFVGTQTVTATATAAAYSSANVGSYPGTVVTYTLANGANGGLATNYSLAPGTATGTITAKALSITAPTIASKVYDGTTTAGAVTTGTLSGFVGTETVTATATAAAYSSANVGSYSGNVVTYTLADGTNGGLAANYSLANGTATGTITAKALSVTAPTIASKVYNNTTTAGAVTVGTLSGFIGSETVTATATAAAYSSANVGSYPGVVVTYTLANGTNGGLAANYSLATGTATGVITAKALSITTATIASKVYNASAVTGAVTVGTLSGFVGTQTVTATATGLYADANVGTGKTATITYTLANGTNGGLAANYSLANTTATGNITAKTLSITAASIASKVYDGNAASGTVTTGTLSGFVGTETVTATATGLYANANVGTGKVATVTYTLVDGTNGGLTINYSLANGTATGNITAKPLSITAPTIAARAYNGTTTAGAVTVGTLSGFIGSETVTATATAAAYSSAAVGSYPGVVVTYTLANGTNGGLATNYSLANETATGVITGKALTVTATGPSKPYGTALSAGTSTSNFTAGSTGVGSETVTSVTLTPDAAGLSATTPAGTAYVVTPSAATGTGGFSAGNYDITYVDFNGTVGAADLTITANNQSKCFGQTFTFDGTEFSSNGLLNGDAITSVTLESSGAVGGATAGTYSIIPSAATGSGLSNYNISYVNGTFTVYPTYDITLDAASACESYVLPWETVTETGDYNHTYSSIHSCDSIVRIHVTIYHTEDDGNVCTTDGCNDLTGPTHTNLTNVGGGESDGLVCTQDNCSNGSTVHPSVSVDDSNPCTADACAEPTGVYHTNLTNIGGGTSDGLVCTSDDCENGVTAHNALPYDDANSCTADGCAEPTGIFHTNLTNIGGGESDGLVCTQDNCSNGSTVHPDVNMDDSNPCTADGCSEPTGVYHTNLTNIGGGTSDGLVCTSDDCENGVTAHNALPYDDSNPCTADGCAEPTGIFHTNLTNIGGGESDGLVCTSDDCADGATVHNAVSTDDSNPCTTDGCTEPTGIYHTNLTNIGGGASDGLVCTSDDCADGSTVHNAIPYDDANPCTADGCAEPTGIFHTNLTNVGGGESDGLVCTSDDCADGATVHNAVSTDDSNPCTTDGCSEPTGVYHTNLTNIGGGESDGLVCTSDDCEDGVTAHNALPYDDANPCTADGCAEPTGIFHTNLTNVGGGESDGLVCTSDDCADGATVHNAVSTDDSNPCTTDGCTEPTGIYHTNLTNIGGGASDGLVCTSDDCENGATAHNAIPYDDANPCTADGCAEPSGVFHTNLTNVGGGESDGLVCTSDDCADGATVHNAISYDDSNPCTADGCTEPTGVYHTNLTNIGGGESDGLVCTSDDCEDGSTAHNALPYDDSNPCTADGCAEPTGIYHTNLTNIGGGESDGLVCTSDDCADGATVHNAVSTDDSNPCTTDGCTEPTGIYHTNLTNIGGGASDGLVCTSDDCADGATVHNAIPYDDSNPCTADGCAEPTGIFHTNLTNVGGGESDGLVCTSDDCADGSTVHNAIPYDDANPCTSDGCAEPTGIFHTNLTNVGGGESDGLVCTSDDCADGSTVHNAIPYDDSNPCTADGCSEPTGVYHTNLTNIGGGESDGLVCTSDDCADGATVHNAIPYDDANPCTADGCSEPGGVFHTNLTNIGGGESDGLVCTSDDCADGSTAHNALPYDDANPCTADGCAEPTGIFHTNLTNIGGGESDGLVCTSDDCADGSTVHNAIPYDDANPCTADGCAEPSGVFHTNLTNVGGGESDGLVCTSDDCADGSTVHNAIPYDDANPCTADGCSEPTGVFHTNLTNVGGGESDGLVCTSDDCADGATVHNALPYDDSNPCTADGCSEPGGVFHTNLTNIGGGESDGLVCTSDDCNNGVTEHNALPTDDSNPCTADGCAEPTGVFHTNLTNIGGGESDGLVCTSDDCADGVTVHNAIPYDDANPCTADGCAEPTGVYHTNLTNVGGGESDGLVCTSDDCADGSTVHNAIPYDDSNPCTADGCAEPGGVFHANLTNIGGGESDGLVCTSDDCADGATVHNAIPYDDANPCTADGCTEPTGVYHTNLTNVGGGESDGLVCTSDDCADGATVHNALPYDDSNPCTADGCSEPTGVFHTNLTNVGGGESDGLVCTSDDCADGATVHNAIPYDDANPCTADGCSEPSGVFHTNLTNVGGGESDGLVCTSDDCADGATVHNAIPYDDANPCTADGCAEPTGVYHTNLTNIGGGESDGLVCTSDDCADGATVHNAIPYDDANPCTADGCSEPGGVFHTNLTNVGGGSSDGLVCTSDDCADGATVHNAIPYDDSNPCTADGCTEPTGVYHTNLTNIGGGESDGLVCTSDDCADGSTVHNAIPYDDANPCTADGCAEPTGVYHTNLTNIGGGESDGLVCTSDDCEDGATVHNAIPYDDANPCTADGCAEPGGVFHTNLTNVGGGESDGLVCTSDDCADGSTVHNAIPYDDANPCTADGCSEPTGVYHTNLTNIGGGESDGLVCTSDDCADGATVHNAIPYDDANPCTADGCAEPTGVFHTNLTNVGGGESDGLVCTSDDCNNGATVHNAIPYDDANPCTADGCAEPTGVFHTNLTNIGGGASDGLVCTSDDCNNGVTVHNAIPYDDANPCTADGCSEPGGVFHTNLTNIGGGSSDGLVCTSDDCNNGATVHNSIPYDDSNPCTADGCAEPTGVYHTNLTNIGGGESDGLVCTSDDCADGSTVHNAIPYDDANPCTADGCSEPGGVFHTNLTNVGGGESDGLVCTSDDCEDGATVHNAIPYDDANPCTADGCSEPTGIFHTNLTNIGGGESDGLVCTSDDCADGATVHNAIPYDDANPCTADGCTEPTGVYHTNLTNIGGGESDGLVCTSDDCADGATVHNAIPYDDANPCTADGCTEPTGVFHTNLTNIGGGESDGLVCTSDDCADGSTVHNAIPYDDANPCTADGCAEPTGVFHTNLTNIGGGESDGLVCTSDDCSDGTTVHNAIPYDDANPCTADGCSEPGGVFHTNLTNVGGGESDGLVCTSDDCADGSTVHNAIPYDDANPCTADGCAEPTGVYHTNLTNIGGGESDGLVCTSDDCADGATVHNAIPYDDANPCTADGCSEPGGVFHTNLTNIGGGESDGLVCTSDDCADGSTVHNAIPYDDANPCTADGCAEPTGVYHTNLTNIGGGESDGLVCTSDDCADGSTVHNAIPYDDANPCTADGCSEPTGVFHTNLTNIGGGESDGLVCTSDDCADGSTVHNAIPYDDANPCTADGCSEPGGVYHTNLTNIGGGESDGLVCTSDDCADGSTVHNAIPYDDANPCTADGCSEPGGVFHTNLTNVGGGESDGLVCTSDDCNNGVTEHNAIPYDDANPCTADGCSEPGGVFHTNLTNIGGGESDGLVCTSDDCADGATVHNAIPYDDANPCTADGCTEPTGVYHTNLTNIGGGESDGLVCTSDDCADGSTVHNAIPYDDANPCTADGCAEPSGIFHTNLTNIGGGESDGLVCTSDDCADGSTVHNAIPYDDANPCTADGCTEPTGIYHTNLTNVGGGESDGLVCTSDDCADGATVHNAIPYDDANPCTADGCSEPGGVYHTNLTNIGGGESDGLVCTSDDCADGVTVHNAIPYDDANPCTADGCAEPTGVFHTNLTNIGGGESDGLVCTSDDCNNGVTVHNAIPYDDANPCTADGCSEPGGVFHTNLTNVGGGASDGLVCTSDDCNNGATVHNALPTDDSNPCTADGCAEPGGVFHTNLTNVGGGESDGLVCTSDDCADGATVHNAIPYDDANPCTADGCAEPTGVFHTNLTNIAGGESDALVCTSDDCADGATVHNAISYDDGNPCTADGCAEPTGEFHDNLTNIGGGESDGLVCTSDDCEDGITVNNAIPYDDANPCTADGCAEPTGVFHTNLTNVGGGESDGLVCTSDDCADGSTVHNAISYDDANPCTADGCIEPGGVFHTPLSNIGGGESDGLVCTSDDCEIVPAPVTVISEGFDGGSGYPNDYTPSGWIQQNNSDPLGSVNWYGDNINIEPHSGAGYIGANYLSGSDVSTLSNWLISPAVTLHNGDEFSFWTLAPGSFIFPDRLQVRMSTNGASTDVGTSATSVGDFTTLLLDINPAYTTTDYPGSWTQFTITVSGLGSPVSGRLAFRYFVEDGGPAGNNSNYIGIDDALLTTIGTTGITVHNAVATDDSNPCTADGCTEPTGIYHTNLTNIGGGESDGLVCTSDDCADGATVHSAIPYDDANPCTADGCSEPGGVFHTNLTNVGGGESDGLVCTSDDCADGATVHNAIPYDDANPCTADGCAEPTGVYHTNLTNIGGGESDGLVCTSDDCADGSTVHNAIPYDDANPCTADGCAEPTGVFHTNLTNVGGGASDGLVCTSDDCADGATVHNAIPYDDANPCTADGCSEPGGVFHTNLTNVGGGESDGLVCTSDDCADGSTVHNAIPYDDANPCTADGCSEPGGVFHTNLTNVGGGESDGLVCTSDDCADGVTVHNAIPYDDANPCTADGCAEPTGVFHTNLTNIGGGESDGLVCTSDDCADGATVHNAIPYDDSNPCTADGCAEPGGVFHTNLTNIGGGESDGLVCTSDDCNNGVTEHNALPTDDSNPCTADGCAEPGGVFHTNLTNVGGGESDGLVCTSDDCADGATVHNAIPYDDANPCTADGCSEPGGVFHTNLTNIGGGESDGLVCTSDDCSNGVTVHNAIPYDDANPCTADGCSEPGGVFHTNLTNVGGGESDGLVCTSDDCADGSTVHNAIPYDDANPCTADGCAEPTGVFHTNLTNVGGGASDGLVCTSDDCADGSTVHNAIPYDDANPCTADGCAEPTGVYHTNLTNIGGGESDGLVCTSDDCADGATVHNAIPYDDANPCTADGCAEPTGVFHTNLTNVGGGESDGLVCTSDDCNNGATVHNAIPYDDANSCTADGCAEPTGVFHTNLTNIGGGASDGLVCTSDDCADGSTVHNAIPYDDANPCTADGCAEPAGVFHTNLTNIGGGSSDGLVCTSDDCADGATVHNAIPYDDANPCTADGCAEPGGVFHTNLTNIGGGSSDGLVCTSDDCNNGVTVHNAIPYDDANPCTADGCAEPTGVFHTNLTNVGGGSSDGLVCTSDDCNNGVTVHNALPTDDSNPCTADGCSEPGGVFHTNLTNVGGGSSDGLVCTSDDCNNGATVHNALPTDDANPCTADGCSEPGGVFHTNLTNVGGGASDGLVCTSDDCNNGATVHNALPTDDSNPCTADGCAEPGGVFHTNLTNVGGGSSDGLVCTSDDCNNGVTVHNALPTDDSNPCTADGCAEPGGVFHTNLTNVGGGASDGLVCTSDDCNNGATVHNALPTDDSNPCTADGCAEPGGVFHTNLTNVGGGSSDGLVCTSDDCNNGATVHNALPTDDSNPCTADGCSEPGGVFHTNLTNVGGGASDGLVCTSDDCNNGVTVHNALPTDDGIPCTTDGCAEPTGVFHTPTTIVVTATPTAPIQCFGYTTCVDVSATGGSGNYTSGTGLQCGLGMGDYTFTVTDNNGCSGTSSNVHLSEPDKVEGTTSSTPEVCGTSNGTASVTPSGGSGSYVSYSWNCSPVQTTQTATGLAAGNYIVTITDNNGCTGTAAVTVGSVGSAPASPSAITGPAGACRGQSGVVYTVANVPGITYIWSLPVGATGSSATNSITVSFSNAYAGGLICVSATNGCGTSGQSCLPVPVITGRPAFPPTPTGPSNSVCGPTTVSYSIPPVANATSYIWTVVGTGFTLASGQGTNSITVNVAAGFVSGQVRVYAASCAGVSSENSLFVYGLITSQPQQAIFPNIGVCGGSTYQYCVTPFNGATSITWSGPAGSLINGLPTPQTLAGNAFCANITFPVGFVSGNVSVYGSSGCGNGPARTVAVRSTPAQPAFISGPVSNVCGQSGVVYSTTGVSGATSYNWTVPAGVNITNNTGLSITVTFTGAFTGSGSICVIPVNGCGAGVQRCLSVTSRPDQPGAITGSASVCKSASSVAYSVPAVAGVNYTWSVTGGASVTGAGANATVNFNGATSSSVVLSVVASNACGNAAAPRTLVISVNLGCRTANETDVASELVAYPNPAHNKLYVMFNSVTNENYTLAMYDMTGRKVGETIESDAGKNMHELDLTDFAKGMYILEVRTHGEKQIVRVVVE